MQTETLDPTAATDSPVQEGVGLTAPAIAQVKRLLVKEGRPATAGLRLSVTGGGCSGFQYALSFSDEAAEDDTVYQHGDVRVFIDSTSAPYLNGTIVDYVSGLHGAGFRFVNPNADRTCGCGSSFSV